MIMRYAIGILQQRIYKIEANKPAFEKDSKYYKQAENQIEELEKAIKLIENADEDMELLKDAKRLLKEKQQKPERNESLDIQFMKLLEEAKRLNVGEQGFIQRVLIKCRQKLNTWKDLGWSNAWTEEPQIVKDCKKARHPKGERNRDPSGHGLHTEVRCDICNYVYHYDSSG